MSVYEAAQESRTAALLATRDALAKAIDEAPATVLPQLTKQFRDTLLELEELMPSEQKGSPLDELASRRAAAGQPAAEGSKQRGRTR